MEPASTLSWQPSLFDDAEPAVDVSFRALVRHELDQDAWVDHVPGWLAGSDELFAWVLRNAEWHGRDRPMYGRMVTQPRLTMHWPYEPGVVELPAPLEAMRASLSARYGKHFDAVGANLALGSVPGWFAVVEAFDAIDRGVSVVVFSDNVPIEDEVRLKDAAAARDVLVMGPDCGTCGAVA